MAGDFDGDGLADPIIHTEGGDLCLALSRNGYQHAIHNFNTRGYYPFIGDFDGDGKPDIAYLNDLGELKIQFSRNGYGVEGPFHIGMYGIPFSADFDGDGLGDIGVQKENGDLFILFSRNGYSVGGPYNLNNEGMHPIAGRIERGGDLAFMDSNGNWKLNLSPNYNSSGPFPLGIKGTPLLGDFDGDGKADPTVLDKNGMLHIWFSGSGYNYGGPYNLGF
jgi:hypothetical protein